MAVSPQSAYLQTFLVISVAQIACISFRNLSLALRTRELIEKVKTLKKHESAWEEAYAFEITLFIERHRLNILALLLAYLSAISFALMMGILTIRSWDSTWFVHVPIWPFVAGSVFGVLSAFASMWEASMAVVSIALHVAFVLILKKFHRCCDRLVENTRAIQTIIARVIPEDTRKRLNVAVDKITTKNERDHAEGASMEKPFHAPSLRSRLVVKIEDRLRWTRNRFADIDLKGSFIHLWEKRHPQGRGHKASPTSSVASGRPPDSGGVTPL